MTTKTLTMYVAQCDYPGCEVETRDFDKGNNIVYDKPESLDEALRPYAYGDGGGLDDWGWIAVGDKHYCGDHTTWDDVTDGRIPALPLAVHNPIREEPAKLDPEPWLFISDQVFGEFRSDHDKGYHDVSGTYWVLSPRREYEQDRSKYKPTGEEPR